MKTEKKKNVEYLTGIPRAFSFVPEVRTFGNGDWSDGAVPKKCETLQFCYRFEGNDSEFVAEINGRRCSAPFPHFFIKRPGERHIYRKGASVNAFYFSYDASWTDYLERRGLSRALVLEPLNFSISILTLIQKISAFKNQLLNPETAERIDLLAMELLHETMLELRRNQHPVTREELRIREIASWFNANFCGDIDMDALSNQFGFCRRTFLRNWNKYFKIPPSEYISKLKIQEAKRLLAESNMKISGITSHLNFQEDSYFCRFFRRHTGKTPLEYRKSFR